MDFSGVEDQSLPINFEESANPGHLLRLEDTELDVTEKTDNHTTPLRTRTMKEYDQLIADLKKENFSLKLRIYFLEERIQQKLGRVDSTEDIHKANIELKVEVQALKRELTDKHGLLVTASNALDTLELQHKAEIKSARSDHENERLRQAQRIAQLEKLLENANTLSGKKEPDSDMQWARAFSFMDNVSDVDKSDDQARSKSSDCKSATLSNVPQANYAALQKHCKELQHVIDDLHNEIDKYKARNKRLESNLFGRVEELTAHKKKYLKLKMTVSTFIKRIEEKDNEIKELQTQLQRLSDELKQVNTVSEGKNSRIQELENVVGELRSQFEEKRSSNRHDSLVDVEQTVKSLQNSLREKELALTRLHRAYEENESKLKVKNCESSSSTSGFESEMTKLKNKVALHKGCINKIKECFDAMLREGNDVNCTQSGFVDDLSKLVSMVKRLASLDAFSLWESRLNRFLLSLSSKAEELASVVDDNSKYTMCLRDSTVEINRLRFLLSSTEATVRMLGTKLNSHRRSLMCIGQLSTGKHRRSRSNSITSASNTDSGLRSPQDGAKRKLYSSSAPVTPLKSDQQRSSDTDEDTIAGVDIKVMEEEMYRLRLTVESKDNQLERLRADFERTRPRCSCNDVAIQTVIDIQTENKVPLKALAASHSACTLLRRRLEELADFLEQLLQFDENGLLDLSVLTPQKMASIRGHLEMSRVLSSTLSQSLAVCGRTMSFAEDQESDSVFEQSRHSSISGLDNAEEHDDDDDTITSTNSKNVPKSCNKSLFWDPLVSGARRLLTDDTNEDNLLLLLKPTSETQQTSNLDDLLVCSLSSTFHESFLTSTNVNGSRFKAVAAAGSDHAASESDSWSEPDRGVSQQRIGLDGIGLNGGKTPINSPGRNAATSASTTTSESELVSELGVRLNQKAAHRWKSLLKELKAAKSQILEVEELNLSLRAELGLYQRVCNDNSTVSSAAVLSVAQSPSKLRGSLARHVRIRTGDSFIKNADHHQNDQQIRLENHLLEISALRKKLEESIQAYDQLREQLEKKLNSLQAADHVNSNTASRLNAQIESCMKQIEERDSALCSLHKEKGNLLLEIQQLSDDFKAEQKVSESLRAELAEKVVEVERLVVVKSEQDRSLNDMRCDRDKLQQSLCRAQKLLRNNDASVKSLRDANNALQRDLDVARGALREEKGKMDELVSELGAKCKLTQDLEHQVESLRTAVEEAVASTRRICDEQMRIKHTESEAMSAEISTLKQHKSGLEADVVQMRAQLQSALALSQSLKTELCVFERITSTSQNAALESNVTLLVTEIRSLRLQLERSVEANTALRSQLDDNGVKGSALRLDVNFGVDQYASSVSSPDTASSFSYTATTETTKSPPEDSFEPRVNRQLSKSSDYVSDDATRLHHPTDVYSSPDLGIESDPNRCSSLERAASNPTLVKGIHYLEPGMPSIGSEWTRVASAPTKMTTSAAPLNGITTSFCRKRNCTFPLLRSLADNGEESNDQSEGFGGDTGNRDIYVIAHLEHFKMLEQGVKQSLEIVFELRSKLKESSKSNEVVDGDAMRKELQLSCTSLRKCLQENVAVLEQFWNVPLPLVSCDGDSVENRRLETELLRLHRDLARERKRAEDALIKLEAANRIKEGMEKAIVRQLNKTHCVLKKARGNLEIQQQKTASASTTPAKK